MIDDDPDDFEYFSDLVAEDRDRKAWAKYIRERCEAAWRAKKVASPLRIACWKLGD